MRCDADNSRTTPRLRTRWARRIVITALLAAGLAAAPAVPADATPSATLGVDCSGEFLTVFGVLNDVPPAATLHVGSSQYQLLGSPYLRTIAGGDPQLVSITSDVGNTSTTLFGPTQVTFPSCPTDPQRVPTFTSATPNCTGAITGVVHARGATGDGIFGTIFASDGYTTSYGQANLAVTQDNPAELPFTVTVPGGPRRVMLVAAVDYSPAPGDVLEYYDRIVVDIPACPTLTPLQAPGRLLDTRAGGATFDGQFAGGGIRPTGSILTLPVAGRAGIPTGATSAVLNVTAVDATAAGYLTVWPCDAAQPNASNVNYAAGATIPNTVVTRISAGGDVCFYTSASAHLLVDVSGFFPAAAALASLPAPARLLDTRPGGPTIDGQFAGGGIRPADTVLTLSVTGRAGLSSTSAPSC